MADEKKSKKQKPTPPPVDKRLYGQIKARNSKKHKKDKCKKDKWGYYMSEKENRNTKRDKPTPPPVNPKLTTFVRKDARKKMFKQWVLKMSDHEDGYVETDADIEKSAEVIYNELVRQYDLEIDAQDTLKDKANGIMVLNGTIITLITLVMIQLVTLIVKDKIVLVLTIFPYAFFIYSLYIGIKSFETREMSTVSAKNLHEDYYRKSKTLILEQLSSNLAKFIDDNKRISIDRADKVDSSIHFFKYGMISFVIIMAIIGCIHYKLFYKLF